MAKSVTVKFLGFWPTFDPYSNPFKRALEASRQVIVLPGESREQPDILFYSCFDRGAHAAYGSIRIYFTGENDFPNFNVCDYALSFVPSDCGGRNMRYPLYLLYSGRELGPLTDAEALDRGFCSYVVSNTANANPIRNSLPDLLGTYRPLAYGGRFRNNVGGPVADKKAFIAKYKFNLAVENSMADGYVTEKILQPLQACTVPIYWGDRSAADDFNPEAFIYARDFNTPEALLQEVIRIDSDDKEYLRMLRAPKTAPDFRNRYDERLADFLGGIADGMEHKVPRHGYSFTLEKNAHCADVLRNSFAGRRFINWLTHRDVRRRKLSGNP